MHQAVCPNVLIATTLDPQQVFLNDILSIWHKTSLAIFLQNLQFITTLDNKRSYKKQILQNILGFRKIWKMYLGYFSRFREKRFKQICQIFCLLF